MTTRDYDISRIIKQDNNKEAPQPIDYYLRRNDNDNNDDDNSLPGKPLTFVITAGLLLIAGGLFYGFIYLLDFLSKL